MKEGKPLEQYFLCIVGREAKCWKAIWQRLLKLEIPIPIDPAIPLLGVDSHRNKGTHMKDTSTRIFMAALFLMMKNWKQSRCPSTEEGLTKSQCNYTLYH